MNQGDKNTCMVYSTCPSNLAVLCEGNAKYRFLHANDLILSNPSEWTYILSYLTPVE